jgi:biopolymer transport protein ExbB
MLSQLETLFPWFTDMAELGGDILLLILAMAAVMWALVSERLIYLWLEFPAQARSAVEQWAARQEHQSWCAQQYRERLLLHLKWGLRRNISLIRVLITLCPLLGLLGTVLGMLEVFDAMAATGNNNARATAAGVSKATITTMAGMVVAISGMLVSIVVERKASVLQLRMSQALPFSTKE